MALRRRESRLKLTRQNILAVNQLYPNLAKQDIESLRQLTKDFRLAVAAGELLYFGGAWYITHAGLLRIAHRNHCSGIITAIQESFCDPVLGRWVFKATVYTSTTSRPFVGFGDAEPSNVSLLVRGAEMRVAETRAVNRALRKAYYKSLIPVIEQAVETAALMLGSDKSRGYCLEMICADFLAGANLETGNPDILLWSVARLFKLLPWEQQQQLLAEVQQAAA